MPADDAPRLPSDAAVPSTQPQAWGRVESLEQLLLIAALVALTLAICWGVLSRYVVTAPAAWVEEVSSIAFSWLIFVGAAEVHRRRQHISVDILTALLPTAAQRLVGLATEIATFCFCLAAAYLGAQQALASRGSHTSILHIPLWINYLGLTIGFALMAFRSAQYLRYRARSARAA